MEFSFLDSGKKKEKKRKLYGSRKLTQRPVLQKLNATLQKLNMLFIFLLHLSIFCVDSPVFRTIHQIKRLLQMLTFVA